MALIPYAGWGCSQCKKGSNLTKRRCRTCGRKRTGGEVVRTFYRRPRRKWPGKRPEKKVAT